MIPKKVFNILEKQQYRIVGNHSAVKTCFWTKKALTEGRLCYKRWYGIESHRCVQMTPSLPFCSHKCIFCWRLQDLTYIEEPKQPDDPIEIIEGCIKAQRKLLSGFKGNPKVPKKRFEEAMKPRHFAISLAGEPCYYPRLSDLTEELIKRKLTVFLVTNGTRPDRLKNLEVEPTNLYISLCAPDKEAYLRVNRPLIPDGWERLNESLELMKNFSCRTVIRLTLAKGLNMVKPEKYAKLIKKTNCDFVECKSYMHIGESQKRLSRDAMPSNQEINDFALRLSKLLSYNTIDNDPVSRVTLLAKKMIKID